MSYGGQCAFCSGRVEAEFAAYSLARGYEFTRQQGGANVIHGRIRKSDWIAHIQCVERALANERRGIASDQTSML